jgi:hypothetical protein
MTKTKVVDLEELFNFVLDNLFIWNNLSKEIMFEFLTFAIQIFQMTLDEEMTKTNVADLKKLCTTL